MQHVKPVQTYYCFHHTHAPVWYRCCPCRCRERQISLCGSEKAYARGLQGSGCGVSSTSAWKVTWNYPDIDAEHYIRQSDSAPLYVKRVNRILHQTVEVFYSIEAEKPHLYTRRTANKFYEKKIWKIGLRDLGTLPQMLLDLKESKDAAGIVFPAIQYSDGEVYDLLAKKRGYRRNSIDGRAVASIVYHININSWLSILSPPVKIELPKHDKNINFFTYSGPDLANSGDISTFHLSHKATELASQKQKEDQR